MTLINIKSLWQKGPLLTLTLTLASCTSYSNSFDCPLGQGLKCASLSEVNDQIDDGRFSPMMPSAKGSPQKVYWRDDPGMSGGQGH